MCIVYRVIHNNKWHTLVTNLHLVILKHCLSGDNNTMESHHRITAIFVELQKIGRCIWSNWKLTLWQMTKQQQLRNVLYIMVVNISGGKFGESTLQGFGKRKFGELLDQPIDLYGFSLDNLPIFSAMRYHLAHVKLLRIR